MKEVIKKCFLFQLLVLGLYMMSIIYGFFCKVMPENEFARIYMSGFMAVVVGAFIMGLILIFLRGEVNHERD